MFASPAELDEVTAPTTASPFPNGPKCTPPSCFVGSYPPVTPAGQTGPFFVNTYYLQNDRKRELVGAVPVRSA